MKKVLSFTLVSLALAALASPAHAYFGGSVRGDMGMLTSQVPYLTSTTGVFPTQESAGTPVEKMTLYSDREESDWDFTGRLFVYTSCAPCSSYIAGSWQGSNHRVNTNGTAVEAVGLTLSIPVNTLGTQGNTADFDIGTTVDSNIEVQNKFSKAKLGMGFDLVKTPCFGFSMEIGASYLNAELNTDHNYIVRVPAVPGQAPTATLPVLPRVGLGASSTAGDFPFLQETHQKTEGLGMYASFKAEYKFPSSCWGNCFGIYGKAEVADIIGRQRYNNAVSYTQSFTAQGTPIDPPLQYDVINGFENRYNNIVEVDLEAALVYSPCFKCWDNMNVNFALGVRTDSFVNLFAAPLADGRQSYMSLTRPTLFLEVGIKV